jgi:hypothetical protein
MFDDILCPDTAEAYMRMESVEQGLKAQQPLDYRHMTRVLDAILVAWRQFPHLRLGQLLDNAVGRNQEHRNAADMFNIQDNELIVAVRVMQEEFPTSGRTADTLGQ